MPVSVAADGESVEANHVYVIPPGKILTTTDGRLRLSDMRGERGKRITVDLFFRSLADTHGPHAAAIVLSGLDSDGALGIKRIKERGGLTIAQNPDEAEQRGMPQAAINTGMVDWILDVAEMPGRLLQYFRNESRLKLPPEDGPPLAPAPVPRASPNDSEALLRELLVFVKMRTKRDFSYYKRATIVRRIGRRMQINGAGDLTAYLQCLRTLPGEAAALVQELLISVTNFFRDRDCFAALEQHIPQLFANKSQSDSLRVWVPACATGEEAYSIGMLLLEHARKLDFSPPIQIFACDLDNEAIQAARAGLYPDTIVTDVSDERLRRFFTKNHHGYRVRRELREMVLFASHDLIKDPPFSRMDLVSCRNLLIYLTPNAQNRAVDIFHFALKPEALLFLGSSDMVEDGPLFRVVDKKHRIYARQSVGRTAMPVTVGPSEFLRSLESHAPSVGDPVIHGKDFLQGRGAQFERTLESRMDRSNLSELHLRLVECLAPPSLIVNAEYEIVHLSPQAGRFVKFTSGEPTLDLFQIVIPALRAELRAALFRATETRAPVETRNIHAEVEGQACLVDLRASPASDVASGYVLVTFDAHAAAADGEAAANKSPTPPEPLVRHLERELEQLRLNLRDTVEQYEASTEELKASNEELQAMNEELRSATEELETSREELQSINEELTTVNQELKGKVDELAHANSDLQNLMGATSIATVFLDRDLHVMRYTPSAVEIFHLIPSDIGRPLAHMRHALQFPDLIRQAERVLQTLARVEREVRDDGRWYLARMQPYCGKEDHIAGVVLTFVDVTERHNALEAQRSSEQRMRLLIESAKDYAIFTIDQQRRVATWNSGAQAMFGYSENEIVGQSADILFVPEDRARGDPDMELKKARDEGRAASERWHLRKEGSRFYGSGSVMPLRDNNGELHGFVKIMRDLTETKRAEGAFNQQVDELARFNAVAVGRELRMIELKKEINELCIRLGESARYVIDPEKRRAGVKES
jgi:two-component system CheB/CheR fusion protein